MCAPHAPLSDECSFKVVVVDDDDVRVGMHKHRAQARSSMQNPQKSIKCKSCNQVFKTEEFMLQHWQDKHNKEHLRKITQDTSDEVQRLGRCVEEAKRQKLKDDRELLQDQQSKKIRLYDTLEAKTKEKLAARDIANAQKQEEQRLKEQQSRADFDNAAQELQQRQARLITLASLECDIQEELRNITRLLQSVPLEVRMFALRHYTRCQTYGAAPVSRLLF
jgi:hypothetical protein